MRTLEQIRRHYEVEKMLASKLCITSRDERLGLYGYICLTPNRIIGPRVATLLGVRPVARK